MKANYSKMYQLQNFGEERLQHWNLAAAVGGKGHVDVTRMTHAERREALEVKIADVVNNPLAAMANANYNVRWDDVEGEEAQRAAAAAVEIGAPPNPVQQDPADSDFDDDGDDSDSDSSDASLNGDSASDDEEAGAPAVARFWDAPAPRPPRVARVAVAQGRVAGALRAVADAHVRRLLREDQVLDRPENPLAGPIEIEDEGDMEDEGNLAVAEAAVIEGEGEVDDPDEEDLNAAVEAVEAAVARADREARRQAADVVVL